MARVVRLTSSKSVHAWIWLRVTPLQAQTSGSVSPSVANAGASPSTIVPTSCSPR
jgi:hypothetical protein